MRRIGVRCGREVALGNLRELDVTALEGRAEPSGALAGECLGGDECSHDRERGLEQLFDGADAFRDEETLALARFTTLKITRERQQLHVREEASWNGICPANRRTQA